MSADVNAWYSRQIVSAYVLRILLWLAVLLLATGAIDYVFGWRTLFLYADSLFIVGGLCLTVGALGLMRNAPRKSAYPFGSSIHDSDAEVRARRAAEDKEATYSFAMLAISAGFALVLMSILIHQVI